MLYNYLNPRINENKILVIASAISFILTFICMAKPFKFLPRDGGKYVIDADGKKVAINENSNGKVTGAGFVFVIIYLVCELIFLPFTPELLLYIVLCALMMLTGFLDDAAKSPWGELIKGILDLIMAA